jgi:Tol biopolymer transport system component
MLAMLAVGLVVASYVWQRGQHRPGLIERRLTANSSELAVWASAISPDGRYLAYSDDSGIHLKVIDTAETHDLPTPTGSRIKNLAWFPEGNKVLASAEAGEPTVSSLWTISILGGAPQKLKDDACDGNVFEDGAGIVFVSGKGKEIWQMGPEGEEARKLITASEGESYAMPAVAKGRLWYEKGSVGGATFEHQVESRDLKGGPPTILVSHLTNIFAFLLLPNGRFIYSMTDRPGLFYGGGIWETWADVHTGFARSKPRRLADSAGFEVSGLSATADGKRLAFLKERRYLVSVYVGELQGNGSHIVSPQRLTLSDSLDWAYAWTPDSKSVLFDSNRSGTWDIFKQSLDQRTAVKLVASPGARHRPAMSPDGASVLYLTFNPDGYHTPSRIMRVALTGGPPQWLGEIQNIGEIRCARMANLCVVGDYGPRQRVFYALDPVKGKGRELLRIGRPLFPEGDKGWDVSPDGSSLVFIKDDAEKGAFQIQIRPLSGGRGRELNIDGWTNAGNIRWAADGRGWYVTTSSSVLPLREGDWSWTLLKVDVGGKAQQLMQGFTWADAIPAPDGRHVAVMGWVPASNAWMWENF